MAPPSRLMLATAVLTGDGGGCPRSRRTRPPLLTLNRRGSGVAGADARPAAELVVAHAHAGVDDVHADGGRGGDVVLGRRIWTRIWPTGRAPPAPQRRGAAALRRGVVIPGLMSDLLNSLVALVLTNLHDSWHACNGRNDHAFLPRETFNRCVSHSETGVGWGSARRDRCGSEGCSKANHPSRDPGAKRLWSKGSCQSCSEIGTTMTACLSYSSVVHRSAKLVRREMHALAYSVGCQRIGGCVRRARKSDHRKSRINRVRARA